MNNTKDILAFRAVQLCIMHLTRSGEIKISQNYTDPIMNSPNELYDLLCDINDNNFFKGYTFGIVVKATNENFRQVEKIVTNFKTKRYKSAATPALLIVFEMTTDKGHFAWINSPLPDRQLQTSEKLGVSDIHELNTRDINDIVKKIKLHYQR